MAGAPAGFGDLMDRKYANLEAGTQGENTLRAAQAQSALGSLPSENALRAAQAFSTRQQGGTFDPLARASIQATQAGIGLTGAQERLTGAQERLTGAQAGQEAFGQGAAGDEPLRNYFRGSNWTQNYGLPAGAPGYTSGEQSVLDGAPGGVGSADRLTDPTNPRNQITLGGASGSYAAGTASVPAKGEKTSMKGPNNGTKVAAPQPLLTPNGGLDLHAIMAHAISALHADGGASGVKAAGGATSIDPIPGMGGSWSGPLPNPNTPQPTPSPPVFYPVPTAPAGGRTFGKRVQAAGGATDVKAPGQTPYNGSWTGPTQPTTPPPSPLPGPATLGTDLRRQLGYGIKAAGGATTVNAKGGKTTVPGKGPSNVDSVPATLAPKEAVLNAGAAHHLGRGTIAVLNAMGAAKMAQAGMPPETPPTAGGVPVRAARKPQASPVARGMPKPAGKVAPKAKAG